MSNMVSLQMILEDNVTSERHVFDSNWMSRDEIVQLQTFIGKITFGDLQAHANPNICVGLRNLYTLFERFNGLCEVHERAEADATAEYKRQNRDE